MSTFCYLAGDNQSNTCAVIDPAFDTDKILNEIKKHGWVVTHIINTHCHSDHSAGNAAMIKATGASLAIHKLDAVYFERLPNKTFSRLLGGKGSPKPDVLLSEGDNIQIGEKSLRVIHTPGHTPGGICLYTNGHLFTGDTLFVESVGRTDLPGGSLETLAASVKEKLYTLPYETIVWPGHDYGPKPNSTIGHERKNNLYIH